MNFKEQYNGTWYNYTFAVEMLVSLIGLVARQPKMSWIHQFESCLILLPYVQTVYFILGTSLHMTSTVAWLHWLSWVWEMKMRVNTSALPSTHWVRRPPPPPSWLQVCICLTSSEPTHSNVDSNCVCVEEGETNPSVSIYTSIQCHVVLTF